MTDTLQKPTPEHPISSSSRPEVEPNGPLLERESPESTGDWKIIPAASEIDEDLKAGKLITHRVYDVASAISTVKARAKNASSLMRFGIETFDFFADPLLLPIVRKLDENVVGAVDPMISYAYKSALLTGKALYDTVDTNKDGKISLREAASAPVNIFQSLVVESEWFDKVDDILNPDNTSASKMVELFNKKAKEVFENLVELAKDAKSTVDEYTSKEFVDSLKEKMGDEWDEKLRAPAEEFYSIAKTKYKSIDKNGDGYVSTEEALAALKPVWEEKVVNLDNTSASKMVELFNKKAKEVFEHLVELAKDAKSTVDMYTSKEFVDSLKEKMGDEWDEKLRAPAEEFYSIAKTKYKSIDKNGDGHVSTEEALAALKPVWEEKVVKAFKNRIRPAIKVYKSILKEYKTYRKMAEQKGLKMTADEFVARTKARLSVIYDERLAPHIKEVYEGASKILAEDLERIVQALDLDDDGVLTLNDILAVADRLVETLVEIPYQKALRHTLNAADYVLPTDEKVVEEKVDAERNAEDLSLSLVTKTISKRLVRKASTGLSDLKVRAEKLIGPNLIKYAEDLIRDVHDKQLAPAITSLEERVKVFKEFMTERMKPVQSAALEVMESPRAQELKKRFALAIERARSMAMEGCDYMLNRDLFKLPVDIAAFFAMTVGIKKRDPDFGLVEEHVSGLLDAILNVVKIVNWKEEKELGAMNRNEEFLQAPDQGEEATKEAKEKEGEDKQSG